MALFLQSIKLYPIALGVYSPCWDLSCPQQTSFLKPVCCCYYYYYYNYSFGIKIRAPDGIETLIAFLICLNVSAWCSYESHVLVQNWLCDCVMQLWVTRACPDLCDCVMLLWVTRACPDLTIWLHDADLVKDPHFTLARHRISSNLVVRASD